MVVAAAGARWWGFAEAVEAWPLNRRRRMSDEELSYSSQLQWGLRFAIFGECGLLLPLVLLGAPNCDGAAWEYPVA